MEGKFPKINRGKVALLIEMVFNRPYGETIPHEEILAILGMGGKDANYYAHVSRARKECLKRGRLVKNIPNQGYRVIEPDEYAGAAVKQYVAGAKHLSHGQKILQVAPVDSMTDHGRRVFLHTQERAHILNAHMAGAVKELNLLQKPHPLSITTSV